MLRRILGMARGRAMRGGTGAARPGMGGPRPGAGPRAGRVGPTAGGSSSGDIQRGVRSLMSGFSKRKRGL
ncbi:MAG TPA: hypothetical protein VHG70_09110 [Nocardioidaceae bacterium]|nr:hypothetical protein [Nocardioidaceae bacterium]